MNPDNYSFVLNKKQTNQNEKDSWKNDDANREYVITDPKTPWPWINYLGNEDFFKKALEQPELLARNASSGYVPLTLKGVDAMSEAVKQHGWDGEWFLRAYDFFGKV